MLKGFLARSPSSGCKRRCLRRNLAARSHPRTCASLVGSRLGMAWWHRHRLAAGGHRRTGLSGVAICLLPLPTCLCLCTALLALGTRASGSQRNHCRRPLGTLIRQTGAGCFERPALIDGCAATPSDQHHVDRMIRLAGPLIGRWEMKDTNVSLRTGRRAARPSSFGSWLRRLDPDHTRLRRRDDDDDDDDPPPCPAVISPIPRFPLCGAENALEAA